MDELAQFDKWRAVNEILDMQCGQGDQVCLRLVASRRIEGQQRVSNLLDVDCPTKTGLLSSVSLQPYAILVIRDAVGGDRRMVTDLFGDQASLAKLIVPRSQEQFTQERVQRFLL